MAKKQYKIKRYNYNSQRTFKAGPRPISIILGLLLAGALVFVGISIYKPVVEFVAGLLSSAPSVVELSSEPPPPPSEPPPSSSQPEPEPEPLPQAPEQIRAVFMPHEAAVYHSAWDDFLSTIPEDCNTVMLEIKNQQGNIQFSTKNEAALAWGVVAENPVDLKALSAHLREKGLYLGVRMSAFSDPLAARADYKSNAIMHTSGVLWLDNSVAQGGKPWLNPYAKPVRDYLTALALEAVDCGAIFVQLDQYQFPQDPTNVADYGETGGVRKQEMLAAFARELSQALKAKGARCMAYLPVGSLDALDSYYNQMCYGGNPLDAAGVGGEIALGMNTAYLPAAESVAAQLEASMNRTAAALTGREIRLLPVLTAPEEEISTQIEAIRAAGAEEYVLYRVD